MAMKTASQKPNQRILMCDMLILVYNLFILNASHNIIWNMKDIRKTVRK